MQRDNADSAPAQKPSKLKKFLLKSWQPVPTWQSTIVLFAVIGLLLIIFGIILVSINSKIVEISERYDNRCTLGSVCEIEITITEEMEDPFFYYELDNFYQNHRRYIKSKSSAQLSGQTITYSTAESDCDPIVTNADVGKTMSINGKALNPDAVAYPCGLIAKSLFTDRFELYQGGTKITIDESNIAWPSDIGTKFKNVNPDIQWQDMTDQHFIVWMRTAGLPNFRKLWGQVHQTLQPGTYTVRVNPNSYDVSEFDGKKGFVISTTGPFGGKNNFLAISYLVVGGVCILISVFFFIRWRQVSKKNK